MKSYEKVANRIIEQIENQDFDLFQHIGIDLESGKPINPKGTNGGVQFDIDIPDTDIFKLEIVLGASDLYTVTVYKKSNLPTNVINIKTKKPIMAHITDKMIEIKDVFAYPMCGDPSLIDVLEALFWQNAETSEDLKKTWIGMKPANCDLCKKEFTVTDTFIDGKHRDFGLWAIFCDKCHETHGVGIGFTLGQKYLWNTGEKIE